MRTRRKAPRGNGAWEWGRTAKTREGLLRAAQEVFGEYGFADAAVAEVVRRAGSSVGSLYHHFGGKTELFMALWERHQAAHENAAATAVARARQEGVGDPMELFTAGARAVLTGFWERRELARLFLDGDGPPGFELARRDREREWVRQNTVLLGVSGSARARLTVAVLTSAIGEAGREVALGDSQREAEELVEAAMGLIHRIWSGPGTA